MKKIVSIIISVALVLTLAPTMAFAAVGTHNVSTSAELAAAITSAADGDTIYLYNGTYSLATTTISKSLIITGQSEGGVVIKPVADTGFSGDARGWILVNDGKDLHISNLTLDGAGFNIAQAIRAHGGLYAENVSVRNIKLQKYIGTGLVFLGGGSAKNITMNAIERVGISVYGGNVRHDMVVDGFSYTGKGTGDWLDYGIEVGAMDQNAVPFAVSINNATISDCQGIATVDGSGSAGLLISTYFYSSGGGTATNLITAAISHTNINNCSVGIDAGYTDGLIEGSNTTVNSTNFLGNQYDLCFYGKDPSGTFTVGPDNYYGGKAPKVDGRAIAGITSYSVTPVAISQNTNVTAGVEPSYIIVIPAAVDFGTLQQNTGTASQLFPVSARNVVIEQGSKIDVGVANIMAMKDQNGLGTNTLAYGLKNSTASVMSGGTFASFTGNGLETGSVSVDTGAILKAGSYRGTMDFTISYE